MAVSFQRNVGMLLLAVWLILYGFAGMLALVLPRSAELSLHGWSTRRSSEEKRMMLLCHPLVVKSSSEYLVTSATAQGLALREPLES
jgi:hypothetical protein